MKTPSHSILRIALILASFAVLAACTQEHRVRIDPELYVRSQNFGQGQRIGLKVTDRRKQNAIYNEEMGPKTAVVGALNKVNIYPKGTVDDPIEEQVKEALTTLGYVPVDEKQKADRTMEVQILQLRMLYSYEDPKIKIPEKKVRLHAALGVVAQKGERKFKKLYKTHLDKSQNLLTGEVKNEQFINDGLSMTLQKIFEDRALLLFLSPEG